MPAPPKIPNLGSQLDRAIVAWLTLNNCGYVTDTTAALIVPGNTPAIKISYPVIIAHAARSTTAPQNVGTQELTVQLRIEQTSVLEVNDPNPENTRVVLDQLVGQVAYQMLQSTDRMQLDVTCAGITAAGRALATDADPQVAANNADMVNFTVQYLRYDGQTRGKPSEEGASWVEILNFTAIANASAIDMS